MVSSFYIRLSLAFILIAAIIGIVTVIIRSDPQGSSPLLPVSQQLPKNIDIVLKKARFTEIQNGHILWELIAERVNYDKTGEIAYLSDIRMQFQRTATRGGITVLADSGEYSNLTKNVTLKGSVHVETEDGENFETASILYSGALSRFSTQDPVSFRKKNLQLKAIGMDLSVQSQLIRFHSAVDASMITN